MLSKMSYSVFMFARVYVLCCGKELVCTATPEQTHTCYCHTAADNTLMKTTKPVEQSSLMSHLFHKKIIFNIKSDSQSMSHNLMILISHASDKIKNPSDVCVCVCVCRALCYLKQERFTEAKQDCDAALKLEPSNKKAFYRRALANKGLKVKRAGC